MGQHIHKISGVDEDAQTATCEACGVVRVIMRGGYWTCHVVYQARQDRYNRDPRYKAIKQAALDRYHQTPKGKAMRKRGRKKYRDRKRAEKMRANLLKELRRLTPEELLAIVIESMRKTG